MSLILSGTDGLSDIDGTAATPAIRGTDANTGIFFGTDIIGFSEGGVEAARINADSQFVAAAGTAALPVITTTGDLNTGIFFPAADTIAFSEGGVEAMRLDASGRLGIGTTSPSRLLHVQATGTGNVATFQSNAGPNLAFVGTESSGRTYLIGEGLVTAGNFSIYDSTGSAERLVIDSSGNVGIGTSSPSTRLHASGTDTNPVALRLQNTTASTGKAWQITSTNAGSLQLATIAGVADYLTVDSSGNVILGGSTVTTNPISARVNGTALSLPATSVNMIARAAATQIALQFAGNSGQNIQFYTDNGSGAVTAGTITSTGTATAYGVGTSDYRAKENVTNYTGGLSTITSLRPVSFTWKESQEQDIGFIAHEIQAVIPSTVYGEKDAVDEDGKPKMQTIFPSPPQMIANLVGAIQEQQALIQSLTTRITALEQK